MEGAGVTRWRWAAVAAVALAVAFVAGRLSTPKPVVVSEKKTESEAERKTWDEKTTGTVAIADSTKMTEASRTEERRYRPNGKLASVKVTEKGSASTSRKDSAVGVSASASATSEKVRTVVEQREVRILERPRWAVDGLFGLDLRVNRIYGLAASARVAGPFSVGAWAMSNKTGGVLLRVQW